MRYSFGVDVGLGDVVRRHDVVLAAFIVQAEVRTFVLGVVIGDFHLHGRGDTKSMNRSSTQSNLGF